MFHQLLACCFAPASAEEELVVADVVYEEVKQAALPTLLRRHESIQTESQAEKAFKKTCQHDHAEAGQVSDVPVKVTEDSNDQATPNEDNEFFDCEEAHPDFSGHWLLSKVEGEIDGVLKEIGYPWVIRKLFAAFNFGVNKTRMVVLSKEESVNIRLITEAGTLEWDIVSDGKEREQSVGAKEFERCIGTARWEGPVHITESRLLNTNKPLPPNRRYLEKSGSEDKMIVEQVTKTGMTAKSTYVRYTA